MIVLNIIGWIMLVLTVIACICSLISSKDEENSIKCLFLLAGYICTVIAYMNK